ncbi:hypothetical protein [Rickettsia canadensis]|nr:hypothetical protein [Rickettsia canadensis]
MNIIFDTKNKKIDIQKLKLVMMSKIKTTEQENISIYQSTNHQIITNC